MLNFILVQNNNYNNFSIKKGGTVNTPFFTIKISRFIYMTSKITNYNIRTCLVSSIQITVYY